MRTRVSPLRPVLFAAAVLAGAVAPPPAGGQAFPTLGGLEARLGLASPEDASTGVSLAAQADLGWVDLPWLRMIAGVHRFGADVERGPTAVGDFTATGAAVGGRFDVRPSARFSPYGTAGLALYRVGAEVSDAAVQDLLEGVNTGLYLGAGLRWTGDEERRTGWTAEVRRTLANNVGHWAFEVGFRWTRNGREAYDRPPEEIQTLRPTGPGERAGVGLEGSGRAGPDTVGGEIPAPPPGPLALAGDSTGRAEAVGEGLAAEAARRAVADRLAQERARAEAAERERAAAAERAARERVLALERARAEAESRVRAALTRLADTLASVEAAGALGDGTHGLVLGPGAFSGGTGLSPDARRELGAVAAALDDAGYGEVRVVGVGAAATAGERTDAALRAERVRAALIAEGLDPFRITFAGLAAGDRGAPSLAAGGGVVLEVTAAAVAPRPEGLARRDREGPASALAPRAARAPLATPWTSPARRPVPPASSLRSGAFSGLPGPALPRPVPPPAALQGSALIVEPFAGAMRFDDALSEDWQRLVGVRVGAGLNGLLGIVGYYWNGVDTELEEFARMRGWGADVLLNLNRGFGLTPYLAAGAGMVRFEEGGFVPDADEEELAVHVGGGLSLPISRRFQITASLRDYLFDVAGLREAVEEDAVRHNLLFSVGLDLALGGGRLRTAEQDEGREAPAGEATGVAVAAAGAGTPEPAPAGAGTAEATPTGALPDDRPSAPGDSAAGPYQGDRSLAIPLPVEGALYVRYGPGGSDPVAGAGPAGLDEVRTAAADAARQAVREELQYLVPLLLAARTPPGAAPGGAVALAVDSAAAPEAVPDAPAEVVAPAPAAEPQAVAPVGTGALPAPVTRAELAAAVQEAVRREVTTLRSDLVEDARLTGAALDERLAAMEARVESRVLARLGLAGGAAAEAAGGAAVPVPGGAPPPAPMDRTPLLGDLRALTAGSTELTEVMETGDGIVIVLGGGAFAPGQGDLLPGATTEVGLLARALRSAWPGPVQVRGHSEGTGDELMDQRLSEARAESVRRALVQAGLAAGRVRTAGYGAARPVAGGDSEAAQTRNRRVEIVLVDGEGGL